MAAIAIKNYDTALKFGAGEYLNPPPLPKVVGPAGVRGLLAPFFAPTLENEFVVLREVASGPMVFNERLDTPGGSLG